LWNLIQQKGNISADEMYRVFNMGIGMIAITDQKSLTSIQKRIPEETFVIGELAGGHKKVQLFN
jgi:phosphoribosylaminoimidazole (AIR) synthetase